MKLAAVPALLVFALALGSAAAQDTAPPESRLKELESALQQGQAKHKEINQRAAALAKELGTIRGDMVAAARAVQEHEETLSELELQLNDLAGLEKDRRHSLDLKRQQMNGVLTALQRLAFRPSEALIAQPTSPADTVRSAILLRDVVPKIKESAAILKAELDSLTSLKTDIARQKKRISTASTRLDGEHRRLAALYERKEKIVEATEEQRLETERRLKAMAGEAADLRDLMARLEEERKRREAEAIARAAAEKAAREAAREAERLAAKAAREAQIAAEKAAREAKIAEARAAKERHDAEVAAAREAKRAEEAAAHAAREAEAKAEKASREAAAANARAQPAPPSARSFSRAQGEMPFPARGRIVSRFGQATADASAPSRGMTLETRPGAQVIAPYDGQVVFAGQFRGYGLLLIIEHGEGYHTLLAGMGRIDSAVGQRLLEGEPVGVMEQAEGKPRLYVELRRNGQPVNPIPWLTARKTKVTG